MAAPATPGWSVESQRATTELDPATQKAVKGMAISIVTARGVHSEVFIPGAVYALGPAAVKPLLAAAALNIDAIHGLAG